MEVLSDEVRATGRRQRLRQQIESLSREVAMLEEMAAPQHGDQTIADADRSLRQLRGSLLQTHLAEKRTQLEILVAQEQALGPGKDWTDIWLATATTVVKTARKLALARPSKKRTTLVLALIVGLALVPAALLRFPLENVRSAGTGRGPAAQEFHNMGELAPSINEPVGVPGETFFTRLLTISYAEGRVLLSGHPYPAEFAIDDRMEVTVTRPDGTVSTWTRTFNDDCLSNKPLPPQDLTDLFAPGENAVNVALYDICGATRGTSGPILLSNQR